jgi:hypothetical protein
MAQTVILRWAKIQSKLQLIASSVKLAECFNIRLESYKARPKYVEVSCDCGMIEQNIRVEKFIPYYIDIPIQFIEHTSNSSHI